MDQFVMLAIFVMDWFTGFSFHDARMTNLAILPEI
jgi:hypothetical protein